MNLIAYDGQIELEEDDWLDADESIMDDDDRDDWGCCLGDECLMPGYDHRASECYNVEMAEAWAEDDGSEGK